MTLFKQILRALAAGLSAGALAALMALRDVFLGPAPSDIGAALWMVLGGVVVFLINWAVGRFFPNPV